MLNFSEPAYAPGLRTVMCLDHTFGQGQIFPSNWRTDWFLFSYVHHSRRAETVSSNWVPLTGSVETSWQSTWEGRVLGHRPTGESCSQIEQGKQNIWDLEGAAGSLSRKTGHSSVSWLQSPHLMAGGTPVSWFSSRWWDQGFWVRRAPSLAQPPR